jgi:glycyl-radical enzyme activating protein
VDDNKEKKGLIFDIQRFSLHDGPGIRTLVFLKGCFLRCKWCANPEGQNFESEMLFDNRKCIICKKCVEICPNKANEYDEKINKIVYYRSKCKLCGKCINNCLVDARRIAGKWYSASEIVDIAIEDEVFFRNSGGGITLGGGEPTFQYDFIYELLGKLKKKNINTAIETCGFTKWGKLNSIASLTDWIIFDIKHIDSKKHIIYTGVSNTIILKNLEKLLKVKKNVIVRLTLITGFNDSKAEKEKIIDFVRSINKNVSIDYINYHEYGKFKYNLLDRSYEFNRNIY